MRASAATFLASVIAMSAACSLRTPPIATGRIQPPTPAPSGQSGQAVVRIHRTMPEKAVVVTGGQILRELDGKRAFVIASMVAESGDPPIESVISHIRSQVEVFLGNNGAVIVEREGPSLRNYIPQDLLNEQHLSVSGLADDQLVRIGRLRVADIVVRVNAVTSSTTKAISDGRRIQVPSGAVSVRLVNVISGEVIWQGSQSMTSTDILPASLTLAVEHLPIGGLEPPAELPTAREVTSAALESLLKQIPF